MKNCSTHEFADATDFVSLVLIDMEPLDNRQFATDWLAKAVETQWAWIEIRRDPAFQTLAQMLVGGLGEYLVSSVWRPANLRGTVEVFDIDDFDDHFGAEFAILVELGFFVFSGSFYHPSIPELVTDEAIQQAALKVASTAIGKYDELHPETILHLMSADGVDVLVRFDSEGVGHRR